MRLHLEDQHGPAYTFIESVNFRVLDEAEFERLKGMNKEEVVDFLTNNVGEKVKVEDRGYWGDMTLLGYSATVLAPGGGDWTKVGSPDQSLTAQILGSDSV